MASRYRWRQQLLGSLQGQLQLATYLVVFLGFTGASSVGLLIGQRHLLANDQTNTMDEKVFPLTGSTTLDWTKNLPSGTEDEKLAPTKGVTIQRTISVNASDQNQIDVSYTTNSGAPAAVTLNASLVPQALSWCP
jgi:hypothetical protein